MFTKAEEVILDYGAEQFKKAITRIKTIQDPEYSGCRCKSCLFTAINEVNYWIYFCEPLFSKGVIGYYDLECINGSLEIVFIKE